MGTYKTGILTQNFKIVLNVENLAEYIADQIKQNISNDKYLGNVEIDENYFEDNELVITGSYITQFTHWHCEPTLESPGEDEVNREYIGNHPWFLSGLPDEIYDNISISDVYENDSMIEVDENETL